MSVPLVITVDNFLDVLGECKPSFLDPSSTFEILSSRACLFVWQTLHSNRPLHVLRASGGHNAQNGSVPLEHIDGLDLLAAGLLAYSD